MVQEDMMVSIVQKRQSGCFLTDMIRTLSSLLDCASPTNPSMHRLHDAPGKLHVVFEAKWDIQEKGSCLFNGVDISLDQT